MIKHKVMVHRPINRDALCITIVRYVTNETNEGHAEQLVNGEWIRYEPYEVLRDATFEIPGNVLMDIEDDLLSQMGGVSSRERKEYENKLAASAAATAEAEARLKRVSDWIDSLLKTQDTLALVVANSPRY